MKFHGIDKLQKFFKDNERRIIIMRGLPGSGKSTITREMISFDVHPFEICSSDSFFVNDKGVYVFDPRLLGINHKKCFRQYIEFVRTLSERGTILVDNTNTVVTDLAPYCRVAEAYDIPFAIVELICDPVVSFNRNVHGVPMEVIYGMYRNLIVEQVPGYWRRIMIKPESSEVVDFKSFNDESQPREEYIPEGRGDSGVE